MERCKRGHLISEVGRTNSGYCQACYAVTRRKRPPRDEAPLRNPPGKCPKGSHERVELPTEPFVDWIRENAPSDNKQGWAMSLGLGPRHLTRLLSGEAKMIHIDIVDRVVGPVELNELYPVEEKVPA